MPINPMILARIRQEAAEIRNLVDDDSETLLDTLDGETDAIDLLDALIREDAEDDARAEACKALAQRYQTRAKRLSDRKSARRGVIGQLLDAIGERKIARPLATVSRTKPRSRVVVHDVEALPQGYYRTERKADSAAIKGALEAGEELPGARLDMGEASISIRSA